MKADELSRPQAFDIQQFFAPEILDPRKKSVDVIVIESATDKSDDNVSYQLSKHLDNPIRPLSATLRMTRELPRGIPWHNFPVVSNPFYRVEKLNWKCIQTLNIPCARTNDSAFTESALVALSAPTGLDDKENAIIAHDLGYLIDKYNPGAKVAVVEGEKAITMASAEELRSRMGAELRFRYSYEVNFRAIAMKAFSALGIAYDPLRPEYPAWRGLHFSDMWFPFGDSCLIEPLSLQWLFRLRHLGSFHIGYAYETKRLSDKLKEEAGNFEVIRANEGKVILSTHHNAILVQHANRGYRLLTAQTDLENPHYLEYLKRLEKEIGQKWISTTVSNRVVNDLQGVKVDATARFSSLDHAAPGMWVGTGKHAFLQNPLLLTQAAPYFVKLGLVEFNHEKEHILLSDLGNRLLDAFHPDCEDPDVVLRWMGEDNMFKPDAQKSCDDWIKRFFSKMKTRINEL